MLQDDLVQINDCEFYGANKPITSIWIKLSPEVQMSLMTLCFAVELVIIQYATAMFYTFAE